MEAAEQRTTAPIRTRWSAKSGEALLQRSGTLQPLDFFAGFFHCANARNGATRLSLSLAVSSNSDFGREFRRPHLNNGSQFPIIDRAGSFADRRTAFWRRLAFGTRRAPEREKAKLPLLPPIRCKSVSKPNGRKRRNLESLRRRLGDRACANAGTQLGGLRRRLDARVRLGACLQL